MQTRYFDLRDTKGQQKEIEDKIGAAAKILQDGGLVGIVTRVGKGTKVVLLGDPAQIDHPLLDTRSNGLTYASARMKGSPLCVQLTMLPDECERSSLALDAAMRM